MTVKEYLGQVYSINREILDKQAEIESYRELSVSISNCILQDRVQGSLGNEAPYVKYICKIAELEKEICVLREEKAILQHDRDPVVRRRYGRAWKRIRDKYVSQHPFCEVCYEKGILVKTEEVHHKIPLSKGGTHDRENLISLCKECHARIHAQNGERWHNR